MLALQHLEILKFLFRDLVLKASTTSSCNFALLIERALLCLVTRLVALMTELLSHVLSELLIRQLL
jgi:hypothetical protein